YRQEFCVSKQGIHRKVDRKSGSTTLLTKKKYRRFSQGRANKRGLAEPLTGFSIFLQCGKGVDSTLHIFV
ncbi:hypothetical protein ABEV55_03660, partial [Aneurinibacillus thermoaerophilus]|uniref:hypothetical protein n=1 Tax=Aneurinibacillus thermoaerophilus TaxID=143495 RepID=UPI002E1D2E81|nr:hypothetical protein [Aneurinibacillus thermoaerophilus]